MGQLYNPRRILVVDDNRDAAELLAEILSLQGHVAKTAFDGSASLQAASEFLPDVVLLDIGMPGMDGYEAAVRLRRIAGLEKVKIIGHTAWTDALTRQRMAEAGFDAHLPKPASIDAIAASVQ